MSREYADPCRTPGELSTLLDGMVVGTILLAAVRFGYVVQLMRARGHCAYTRVWNVHECGISHTFIGGQPVQYPAGAPRVSSQEEGEQGPPQDGR